MSTIEMISIATSFFACLGVFVAVIQLKLALKAFRADHERRVKQSTIEFYSEINKESFWLTDYFEKHHREDPISYAEIIANDELRQKVKRYLSLMERLSVGITSGVFDIHIFDSIAGASTVIKYHQLQNYIFERRKKLPYHRLYSEFEYLAKKIEDIRADQPTNKTRRSKILPKNL